MKKHRAECFPIRRFCVLLVNVGSPYPHDLCFITLEFLLARSSKLQGDLKKRYHGLEIVHWVWRGRRTSELKTQCVVRHIAVPQDVASPFQILKVVVGPDLDQQHH